MWHRGKVWSLGIRKFCFRAPVVRKASLVTPIAAAFIAGVASATLLSLKAEKPQKSSSSTLSLTSMPDPIYASALEEQKAVSRIKEIVGEENVTSEAGVLELHADSPWQTWHPERDEWPRTVVYPNSTEQVSQIMQVCNEYRVPVTPYSAGTSLEGHFSPVYSGISLDMSNMDQVLAVHSEDLDVVVQPAVGWEALNETLKEHGMMFGPDPGPGAQIGGMIGTSCSGTNAYRYGTMRQNVVNLTVVLADGTVVKTRQRPRKSSAGYALTELIVGSEGTLGIVTEATLKIYPIPPIYRVGVMTFAKIKDATDTVHSLFKSGIFLDAIELLDDEQMKRINQAGSTDRTWEEKHTLLLRFAGSSENAVESQIEDVKTVAKQNEFLNFQFAHDKEETEDLWVARKSAAWSVFVTMPPKHKIWSTDVAVPLSALTKIIVETKLDLVCSGLNGVIVGHVGDGNFHAVITYDPATQKKETEAVVDRMIERAMALEGTCTGEHGVGIGKRRFILEELGKPAIDTMRELKRGLDPNFILNPGKIFSVSPSQDIPKK